MELPDEYVAREANESTAGSDYANRLKRLDGSRWRRILNVQMPYRWNIRRLNLGRTLDVGCGLGRNLSHLEGNGVGVDHNPDSIAVARSRGLVAFTNEEFSKSEFAKPDYFDSILMAHVVEHLTPEFAVELVSTYLPFVKPGGSLCFITPQERGYATDSTHITFAGFAELESLAARVGATPAREFSFPFPRAVGKVFPYNEFVLVARLP